MMLDDSGEQNESELGGMRELPAGVHLVVDGMGFICSN
jgi:hypothetical protein